MKEFDLQKWLKTGEPIATRSGREVKIWNYLYTAHKNVLVGNIIGLGCQFWDKKGRSRCGDTSKDLVHPTSPFYWVNVYQTGDARPNSSAVFETYEKALHNHHLMIKQMPSTMKHIGIFQLIQVHQPPRFGTENEE